MSSAASSFVPEHQNSLFDSFDSTMDPADESGLVAQFMCISGIEDGDTAGNYVICRSPLPRPTTKGRDLRDRLSNRHGRMSQNSPNDPAPRHVWERAEGTMCGRRIVEKYGADTITHY